MFRDHLRGAVDLLEQAALELDPKELFGSDATRDVEVAAKAERLAGTLRMLLAQRVSECGTWRGGNAVTEEQWLAQVSGTSEAAARDTLATAHRLEELPATEEQLRAGNLSLAQATQVSAGATADPTAEAKLLRVAEHSGLARLREEKERVVAAATDELEARRRAKRNRHLRTRANGVETTGTFSGPSEEVADLLQVLKPLAAARFNEARLAGEHESPDACRFDALIRLGRTGATASTSKANDHVARVRVDLEALVRGRTVAGEICEIPHICPHIARGTARSSGDVTQCVARIPRACAPARPTAYRPVRGRGAVPWEPRVEDPTEPKAREQGLPGGRRGRVRAGAPEAGTSDAALGAADVTDQGYQVLTRDDGTWELRAPPDEAAA